MLAYVIENIPYPCCVSDYKANVNYLKNNIILNPEFNWRFLKKEKKKALLLTTTTEKKKK